MTITAKVITSPSPIPVTIRNTNPLTVKVQGAEQEGKISSSVRAPKLLASLAPSSDVQTRVGTIQIPFLRLDQLIDVDTAGVGDGYTIVYNTTTQTWDVALMSPAGPIDGGVY